MYSYCFGASASLLEEVAPYQVNQKELLAKMVEQQKQVQSEIRRMWGNDSEGIDPSLLEQSLKTEEKKHVEPIRTLKQAI